MPRTILLFAWVWFSIALSTPLALFLGLLYFIGFRDAARGAAHAVARSWCRSLIAISGSSLEVEGDAFVPERGRVCFYANHQSTYDIMALLCASKRPLGFVVKSQARWIPFVNLWAVLMGSSFIHRGRPELALKTFDRAIKSIARGQAIAIFPEGHRSRSDGMAPFKRGSFKLALRSGATIVPVSISGTARAWEMTHRIRPSRMQVRFHPPIDTAGVGTEEKKSLSERVEAIVREGIEKFDNR
jgi:1-acyl-sn-glycerol-3-phosphate acyltransferase